ncbi:FAD-binding oxidoreductase [Roseateles paludis]|jgi:FAD/FMN-containing dehydrogenase|uniref:FAD-binding oxidoreductase n=1 Tax=Roseateles paludis TaxID=3145238 RepID=A0ABV0G3S5_9BURK
MPTPFHQALRALLGPKGALPADGLSSYETDWRKRYPGRAIAVARPATTEEVARTVQLCAEWRVPIVPQGGNTGLVGASTPDDTGTQLVLSLQRLRELRAIDADNLSLTAEAGCVLADLQAAAAHANLLLPLSLAAEGSCTLGGNLATNAGGTQVLRYGNARELCLGLEVVTPQGEIWHGLSGLRKDNTGYDLRDLFIGSEGTLGIITAATIKLYPAPAARSTALVACPSLTACVALLRLARQRLHDGLTGFEVMNAESMALVGEQLPQVPRPLGTPPWTVLIELSSSVGTTAAQTSLEAMLEEALMQDLADDAAVAQNVQQARGMWQLRESIPLAQAQAGLNIKHDIALPVSAIPDFVTRVDALVLRHAPGARLIDFGHLGDGNLHYNVQAPVGSDAAAFLATYEAAINEIVYDAVQLAGGSISAEHGIGRLKREELARRKDPTALGLMHAIKRALDPLDLFNPGRVL